MKDNNHNRKQDIAIAELKKDVCWLKKSLQKIEGQVFNELPHQIDDIKGKLMYGFIVGIASVLILQIILKFF